MSTLSLILIFTVLSGVLSMVGGVVLLGEPQLVRRFSMHFISFASGALLAGAFLDLLPEAVHLTGGETEGIFLTVLVGIVGIFLVERLIHNFHTHAYEAEEAEPASPDPFRQRRVKADGGQGGHRHATPVLLLIGDGIHNLMDGVIVASAFLVSPTLGVVTAVAVAAHELPQEIADFSIMLHHGWSKAKVLWTNLVVALTAVVGAVITYAAREFLEPYLPTILALTAGIFVYIATSDLFPEIDPETSRDKTSHIIILILLGVAVVYLAGQIEIVHV